MPRPADRERLLPGNPGWVQGGGLLEGLDVVLELFEIDDLGGEGEGVAGGAEADGDVGIVQRLGKDIDSAYQESLEFLAGEVGLLLAEAGQLVAEVFVFKPAADGALADAGVAGGLGDGGRGGDGGDGGLLAKGQGSLPAGVGSGLFGTGTSLGWGRR